MPTKTPPALTGCRMTLTDDTMQARRKRRMNRRRRLRRQLRDQLLQEDPHCWFCGLELSLGTNATFDHFVPHCRGGATSKSNGVLAWADCNETKADLPAELFLCRLPRGAGIVRLWDVPGVQLNATLEDSH